MSKIIQKVMISTMLLPMSTLLADQQNKKVNTIGEMLNNLVTHMGDVRNLMMIVTIIAGFSIVITSIFKFKQVKDNPTQIPIGTPFSLLAVGVMLIFLPQLIKPAAESLFGGGVSNKDNNCSLPGLERTKECKDMKEKGGKK